VASFRSYIICTSPRSGSTLLCKLLAATHISGDPASYFHNPSIVDWQNEHDLSPRKGAAERDVLNAIFDAVRKRGAGGTGMFGLRLQRGSFDFLMQKIGELHPRLSNDVERLEAAFGNILFVHLTRGDKLEQAISLVKAMQTGLWHKAPDGTELERLSAPNDAVYNLDEISRHVTELTALDQDWRDWFAQEKINPLQITYNELSADPREVLARILGQLGLDREAANGACPAVAKLADATSRDWKIRFLAETKDSSSRET